MSVACPACTKPTGDGLLCSACTGKVRKDLEQLPLLMRDLQITYTRQSQVGTGAGSGDVPVPFDRRASKVADEVVNVIGGWIRDIEVGDLSERVHDCTCRPYRACIGYVDVPLASSMSAWCSWLLARLQRIRGHRAVVEIKRDLAAAVSKINRVIDPRADLKFCGFCVAEPEVVSEAGTTALRCAGQLWAKPDEAFTVCPVCRASYDVAASRTQLLRLAEDQLVSAASVLTALPDAYGVSINSNTFFSWTTRGQLISKGHRDGVAVYRLGDALVLARTAATRRKAG